MNQGAAVIAIVLLSLGGASSAEAQRRDGGLYLGGGLGVTTGFDDWPALFELQEEIGYELSPIGLGGEAELRMRLGADLAQAFGDFTILDFGGRFQAAFFVWGNEDVGILITPSVGLGGAVMFFGEDECRGFYDPIDDARQFLDCEYDDGSDEGFFNFQVGLQAELELLDGALTLWLRPIAPNIYVGDHTLGRWDIIFGATGHL